MRATNFLLLMGIAASTAKAATPNSTYLQMSATGKRDHLWSLITADNSSSPWVSMFRLPLLFFENLSTSFKHVGDTMPDGRKKYVHSQGVVAKALFRPIRSDPPLPSSDYTGLFQGPASLLIRLSLATEPSTKRVANKSAIVPAVSVKFLRDNTTSANLFAMFSLDGQTNYNFFYNTLSNHVPPSESFVNKILAKVFSRASKYPFMLGLKDVAAFDSNGAPVENPQFPFQLFLEPAIDISQKLEIIEPTINHDNWKDGLLAIESGSLLYTVYAKHSPLTDEKLLVGVIVSESAFTTSTWADRELFFQHALMEDDFAQYPIWLEDLKM